MPADFADGVDNIDDADANPYNEIQSLSTSENEIILTDGGSIIVPYAIKADNIGGKNYSDNWDTNLENIQVE